MPEYWIHYVGKGLYSPEDFKKEAEKLGVQRAIPFAQIKKFHWGDTVLLAQYQKVRKNDEEIGEATVFGYFMVNGVTCNYPPEMMKALTGKLRVSSCITLSTPRYERRRCGGYSIGATYSVEDTIEEIAEKMKETCMEFEASPNEFKYFLKGIFHELDSPITFSPAKFTRGYMRIETDIEIRGAREDTGELRFIYSYQRRKYLSRKERGALKNSVIEAYYAGTGGG